jgi:hypothetical protein
MLQRGASGTPRSPTHSNPQIPYSDSRGLERCNYLGLMFVHGRIKDQFGNVFRAITDYQGPMT